MVLRAMRLNGGHTGDRGLIRIREAWAAGSISRPSYNIKDGKIYFESGATFAAKCTYI